MLKASRMAWLISGQILFVAFCAAAGYRCAGQIVAWRLDPALVDWELVGTPPAKGVKFIANSHCSGDQFCVDTVTREIYCYNPRPEFAADNYWRAEAREEVNDRRTQPAAPCNFKMVAPPGPVLDRLDYSDCFEFASYQRSWVLLEDGAVWVWQHHGGIPIFRIWGTLGAGLLVGALAGIGLLACLGQAIRLGRWLAEFYGVK